VMDFFEIGSWELFAQGWLWTIVLVISASWEARIIGVNHQCLAIYLFSDRVSWCNPGWFWIWDPPASATKLLGLQLYTTKPHFVYICWWGLNPQQLLPLSFNPSVFVFVFSCDKNTTWNLSA
jgi:hypothetical protein